MEYCHSKHCNHDHRSLQNHKWNLFVCNLAFEALKELNDPVNTANEDGDCGNGDGWTAELAIDN